MECKPGWVKLDGQCIHSAAAGIAVILGLAVMAAYAWYLYKGETERGAVVGVGVFMIRTGG